MDKVADQLYRLVCMDGTPTLQGLFVDADKAAQWCREHGWRPETASLPTAPKKAKRVLKAHTDTMDLS